MDMRLFSRDYNENKYLPNPNAVHDFLFVVFLPPDLNFPQLTLLFPGTLQVTTQKTEPKAKQENGWVTIRALFFKSPVATKMLLGFVLDFFFLNDWSRYPWKYAHFRWTWKKSGSEPTALLLLPKWYYLENNHITTIVLGNNAISNAYNRGLAQRSNLIRNEKWGLIKVK